MKIAILFALSNLALLYPTILNARSTSKLAVFAGDDGVPHFFHLDHTPLTIQQLNALKSDVNSILFTLFTRSNPKNGQRVTVNNMNSVSGSHYSSSRPTFFIIHGWRSSGNSQVATMIRDAFLKVADCNVFVVDWSAISKNYIYTHVAKSVPHVAEYVASFMNFLRTRAGMQTSTMKVVGHSLGAHIASLSARIVSQSSKVAEVVAMDPAKPMFEHKGPDGRVDRSHAKNVQVIHTDIGSLGMPDALGTSDFYANGGKDQPGCGSDLFGVCSHGRSYEYFSVSITNPKGFPGTPKNGGAIAYMGGYTLDPKASGSYVVKTSDRYPYTLSN